MRIYKVLCCMATLVSVSWEIPLVFEDSIQLCTYTSKKQIKGIQANSDLFIVTASPLQIYFKLCGKFDKINDYCPLGTVACLENYQTRYKYNLGTYFHLEESDLLKSTNGTQCRKGKSYSLVVHLQYSNRKPSYIYNEENCTYHVGVTHPMFRFNCGLSLYGRFLDLSPLAKSFSVQSKDTNFSVTLCGVDKSCGGTTISACEIKGNTTIPLALASSVSPTLAGNNHLVFQGNYQKETGKFEKIFKVILKCNWEKDEISSTDLEYVPKQTQGKKYTFKLETSFGCIKKPIPCVVQDGFLIYDLSSLYLEHPYMWSTDGSPYKNESIYFLQMCGPVVLAGRNISCKSTYAQVCENIFGRDINRGSILSNLDVTSDGLTAVIDNGMTCQEASDSQYSTIIYFYCDKEEQGPRLLRQTTCDTYFQWRTPSACPKYNISSCSHIHDDFHNCNFYIHDKYYNLTALNMTETIEDTVDESILFKINICGPIVDADAPCTRDVSVVMKNLSEPNVKYRVFSLGKFSDATIKNGSLVLEFSTGSFCGRGDYNCEIRFECAESEEKPTLIKQEQCHYEFLWKTKYGCPFNKHHDDVDCSFMSLDVGKRIDFGSIKPIAFDDGKYIFTFYVCGRYYLKCTVNQQQCIKVTFENPEVRFLKNSTVLEIGISRTCSRPEEFNRITLNLICDRIKNNDHLGTWKKDNCEISMEYFGNALCDIQDSVEDRSVKDAPVQTKISKLLEDILPEKLLKGVGHCSIKSPFTNHQLNINNFTSVFFKNRCPTVTFNDSFRFVKLLYSSSDVCRPIPSKNISYEVHLMCSSDTKLSPVNEECLQHFNYEGIEYCRFFKEATKSNALVIVGTVLGCMLIIGLVIVGFLVRKNTHWFGRSNYRFCSIYERDAQL